MKPIDRNIQIASLYFPEKQQLIMGNISVQPFIGKNMIADGRKQFLAGIFRGYIAAARTGEARKLFIRLKQAVKILQAFPKIFHPR